MGTKDKKPDPPPENELVEKAKGKATRAIFKIIPYGVQVFASAAAYTLGITATQLVGYCLRVSCRTPVAGPLMGMVGVGFASVLAGQASMQSQKFFRAGCDPKQLTWWEPVDLDDAALDSLMGIVLFKVMGGRFASLMPSDVTKPGALAFESIPAKGEEYAKVSIKRELARIFRRDGCHHCGSRKGPVIGDHMPPNKEVFTRSQIKLPFPAANSLLQKLAPQLLGDKQGRIRQRFYPQCQRCSYKQATALRNNRHLLVLHTHAPRYRSEHLAGIFVGLRHSVAAMGPPSSSSSRGSGTPSMRWNPLQLTANPDQDLTAAASPTVTRAERSELGSDRDDPAMDDKDQAAGELMMSLSQWMPSPRGAAPPAGPDAAAAPVDAVDGLDAAGDGGGGGSSSSKAVSKRHSHGHEDAKRNAEAVFQRHFQPGLLLTDA